MPVTRLDPPDQKTQCYALALFSSFASFIEPELWAIKVYIAEIGIFFIYFAPVTLTLTR